ARSHEGVPGCPREMVRPDALWHLPSFVRRHGRTAPLAEGVGEGKRFKPAPADFGGGNSGGFLREGSVRAGSGRRRLAGKFQRECRSPARSIALNRERSAELFRGQCPAV